MLPLQFFGQNVHFAVSLFAALVFFAVFWLYFDAWLSRKPHSKRDIFIWSGFLVLCLSFVVESTVVEVSYLGESIFGDISEKLANWLGLAGFALIIVGQLVQPLQPKPLTTGLQLESEEPEELEPAASVEPEKSPEQTPHPEKKPKKRAKTKVKVKTAPAVVGVNFTSAVAYLLPAGALTVALLYWHRAGRGLERHLRPVAVSFGLLFIYELLSLAELWRDSRNPEVFDLVKAFGPIWIATVVALVVSSVVLGRWVWQYLTERFISQLFMIFTTVTLIIFLVTTVSFTFLLTRSVQKQTLDNLKVAANVLDYALSAKKAETRANVETVASNTQIIQAAAAKNHQSLVSASRNFLEAKSQSSLLITSASGQVLLRAEDPDRWGDSLSSDNLIRQALAGQAISSVVSQEGAIAPMMLIKSAVPIRDSGGSIVGAAVAGLVIDNGFADGIKKSTGLDSALYSENTLSATTFLAPDGHTRLTGVKENSSAVKKTVLDDSQTFQGALNILNRPYLAVFTPLKDASGTTVGMLFIGQPQTSVLQTAGRSVQLTFMVAAVLLVLSIIPAYLISRHLTRQLE